MGIGWAILWTVCGIATLPAAVLAGRSRRWRYLGRAAVGVLFIFGGALAHVVNLVTRANYAGFADPALFAWVTHAWRTVVPPNHVVLIGLLAVFEAAVGVLVLSGGRRTQLGYAAVIAFYLPLWLFGWIETVWCAVMIPAMMLLLLAERRAAAAAAPSARAGVRPTADHGQRALAHRTSRFRQWRLRHHLRSWGATAEEVAGPYPGAGLVPGGKRSPTMAVTIAATPQQVWPWLVQLGWDRGGWYSWDLLDNAGRRSATEVHPEWQDLAVGDQLKFWALGRVLDAYRVAVMEPNRFLGLYGYTDLRGRWLDPGKPRPSSYMEAVWGFRLNELPDGRTRLVIGGYQTFRPRWVERFAPWLLLAVSWPMQTRMMAVLRQNIERAASASAGADLATTAKP